MRTIVLDPLQGLPSCPDCGEVFQSDRILMSERQSAVTTCMKCRSAFKIELPEMSKKLVYLDQSFISDVWNVTNNGDSNKDLKMLYSKLLELRARQAVAIVVSDIHSQETAAIPSQFEEKRKEIWHLANSLADGMIAASLDEVFVAQQRRAIDTPQSPALDLTDIGLTNPFRMSVGMKIISTNSWRLRLAQQSGADKATVSSLVEAILDSQESKLGPSATEQDCLQLVRDLWRKGLQEGISARKRQVMEIHRINAALSAGTFRSLDDLEIVPRDDPPMKHLIAELVKGLDDEALNKLDHLLNTDSTGGCCSVQLMTAFEAEMLWSWHNREALTTSSPNQANRKWGRSQMQDIAHLSAFLPYVDALTTDNAMANFCQRPLVAEEVSKHQAKIFCSKTYNQFAEWLDSINT